MAAVVGGLSTLVVIDTIGASRIELPISTDPQIKMVGLTVQEGIAYSIIDRGDPNRDILAVPLDGNETYSIGSAFDYHNMIESNSEYVFVVSRGEGTVESINLTTQEKLIVFNDVERCAIGEMIVQPSEAYVWCYPNGRQRLDKVRLQPALPTLLIETGQNGPPPTTNSVLVGDSIYWSELGTDDGAGHIWRIGTN